MARMTRWLAFYTHSSRTAVRLYGDQALGLKLNGIPKFLCSAFASLETFVFHPF